MEKIKAMRLHANRRARERYGIDLTDEVYKEIITNIKTKRGVPGKKITCRVWQVRTHYKGRRLYVVYDRKREALITFLKPEWVCGKLKEEI